MRLIDADALQREYMQFHDGKRSVLVDVAPTIEPKRKKDKLRWVTLAEGWPDDDGVYLVTYKGVTNVALFAWGGWTIGTEDGMGQALPDAWMPLPEPYGGEK